MSESFTFAGFTWPRKISICRKPWPMLAKPGAAQCAVTRDRWCFAYTARPAPGDAGKGSGFYHGSDFAPGLRWQWCDKVEDVRINHTGWFTSPHGDGDTIRGVVYRLPRSRGFLAGHSMGKGMSAWMDGGTIYASEGEAARAADHMAEACAEKEREYQEGYQDGARAFEEREKGMRKAEESLCKARRMRDGARVALRRALAARSGEAMGFLPPDSADHARRLYVECLTRARDHLSECCEARREAWFEWTKAAPGKWQDSQWSNGFRDGACQ